MTQTTVPMLPARDGALHESTSGATRLQGLAPVVADHTVVLVLGSFPGATSLRLQQYYGHPQNQFWRILAAVWPAFPLPEGPGAYAARCQWLLERGVGLWDVYASCERQGSLDTAIRHAQVNDFAGLRARCPALRAIAHNGAESYRHHAAVRRSLDTCQAHQGVVSAHRIESLKLPSTSPANAAVSFARKFAAWEECLTRHGLA